MDVAEEVLDNRDPIRHQYCTFTVYEGFNRIYILFENDGLGMQVGTSILVAFGFVSSPQKGIRT